MRLISTFPIFLGGNKIGKVIQFHTNRVKKNDDINNMTIEELKNFDFDLLEQRIMEAIDQQERDYKKQLKEYDEKIEREYEEYYKNEDICY